MNKKQQITEAFSVVEPEMLSLSRWLHANPELGFAEFKASAKMASLLAAHGFEVEFPAYGLETAYEASIGVGPRVVLCAEFDALPEIGHACGHNIIAAASIGAAIALRAVVDELGVKVTVLGTPAEEGGGGKVKLLERGAFVDAVAAMMIHPSPSDLLDPSTLARKALTVEYVGKESHAAFAPEAGINALDAYVLAYMNVATLRQQLAPGDRVHCIINEGGTASNIITSYSRSSWGIRAATRERLDQIVPRVQACFEAAAVATGCELKLSEPNPPYFEMVHHPEMVAAFAANMQSLGRRIPTEAEVGGSPASTDMGNVSQAVPSIQPLIGIDTGGAVNHQMEFADATVTSSGDAAIRDGALGMAFTVVDMAEQWAL